MWSGRRGANPRHRPWQGRALPLSYSRSTCKIINDAFTLGQRRKRNDRVGSTEAVSKSINLAWAVHARLAHSPLRIFFRRYDATIPHMNDAVAIFCSLGIVGDHQDGLPQLLVRLSQHSQHYIGVFRIQVAGGLVSQDNGRLVDQSSGQGHALLLAAGKFGRPMVKTLGKSQQITDAREMLSIALTIVRYFLFDGDIGPCIEGRQQVELLEYEPDFLPAHASALGVGEQTEIIAIEHDTSGIGPSQPA